MAERDDNRPGVRSVAVRVVLGLYGAALSATGFWAAAFPESFFDDYPGWDQQVWVGRDGPYNEHLVRDVGTLNLALATLVLIAAVHTTRALVTTAAVCNLVNAVPHLVYHWENRSALPRAARPGAISTLVVAVVVPAALLLWVALHRRRAGPDQGAMPFS